MKVKSLNSLNRILTYFFISLIVFAFLTFFGESLIRASGLCYALGKICKFLIGVFYNTAMHWLLLTGLFYAFICYILSQLKKTRYLNTFKTYRYDSDKLNNIISHYKGLTVYVKETGDHISFTSGLWRQALYLSRGTINHLTHIELEALIHHEEAHILNNDLFHIIVAKVASDIFFFLPAIRIIKNWWNAQKEYQADRQAAKIVGSGAVIDALLRVSRLKIQKSYQVASFSSGKADVLKRIKKLQGIEVSHRFSKLVMSITALVLLFLSILTISVSASISAKGCPMHQEVVLKHRCT